MNERLARRYSSVGSKLPANGCVAGDYAKEKALVVKLGLSREVDDQGKGVA